MEFRPPNHLLRNSQKRQEMIHERKNLLTQQKLPQLSKNTSVQASNTHLEILQIKEARKQRRLQNAELKKKLKQLDTKEMHLFGYRYLIKRFQQNQLPSLIEQNDHTEEEVLKDEELVVKVCVRKRPFLQKELLDKSHLDCMTIPPTSSQLFLHEPKPKLDLTPSLITHQFEFSHSFSEMDKNQDIYQRLKLSQMIQKCLIRGGKGTLFAYGQTSSGKSHLVFGSKTENGLFQFLCNDLYQKLKPSFLVYASFYEIYQGRVYDLFANRNPINVYESQNEAVLPQAIAYRVESSEEILSLLEKAQKLRMTGQTEANEQSSRSHAIFQIQIIKRSQIEEDKELLTCLELGPVHALLTLIDLAGSEKASEANASDKKTRMEGAEINKSLLCLKECIRALTQKQQSKQQHIPFRGSKLTMVLRDCLASSSEAGNKGSQDLHSKKEYKEVIMFATLHPSHHSAEHTLNTLRYADRLLSLSGNKSYEKVVDTSTFQISELLEEGLEDELLQLQLDSPRPSKESSPLVSNKMLQSPKIERRDSGRSQEISSPNISRNRNKKEKEKEKEFVERESDFSEEED